MNTKIENMIYEIRGEYVMLDSDLAKIYQVETKRINEAVRRNILKFPYNYSFVLTDEEMKNIEVAICDLKGIKGGRRYNVRVFTEQGVWMLSTILKSKVAINIKINIMDAFVMMRKYISTNLREQKYINNMVIKHDDDIKLLQESFSKFEEKRKINEIYFKGQIYDAYSLLLDILNKTELK